MFAVSASQMQLVREDPENFIDGLVTSRAQGQVIIHTLDGRDLKLRLFEAPADFDKFWVGDPVSFHPKAEILATSSHWLSAKVIP